jgi:predicted nucleic acid-binding protein
VLQQPGADHGLLALDQRVTSLLTEIECLCGVDRAHGRGDLDLMEWGDRRTAVYDQLRRMHRVVPSRSVLLRAGLSLPIPLRALDAVHVATALMLRDRHGDGLVFATHDHQQARAARALGLEVIGI